MRNIKKFLLIALALMVMVSMNSCFGKDKQTEDITLETSAAETETDTQTEEVVIPSPIYKVEIKHEIVTNESYEAILLYPKISGYKDAETEEKVNALIHSYVENKMNSMVKNALAAGNSVGGTANYEIKSFDVTTKNNSILSALCRGSVVHGSYSADFSYGINVDLNNARLMGIESVVDFNNFKKAFENGEFSQTSGYENLLKETNHKDLIAQYDALYQIFPEYYLRVSDGSIKLGIITETVPVLGYTAEFEADITDAAYASKQIKELVK